MIIVTGTGRCGTVSLSKCLDNCDNCFSFHEFFKIKFDKSNYRFIYESLCKVIMSEKQKNFFFADCSLIYTFHKDVLKRLLPDLKIVVLHRDKQATINSFKLWVRTHTIFNREPWKDIFPPMSSFNALDENDYWNKYWDYCNNIYNTQFKEDCFHLNVEDINDDDKLTTVFDFCEIPKANQKLLSQRKYNKSIANNATINS